VAFTLGRAYPERPNIEKLVREEAGMETVKAALRRIGRFIRKVRDLFSGDDLDEAQKRRGDDEEHRPGSWPR
jgi:hypothetical protein